MKGKGKRGEGRGRTRFGTGNRMRRGGREGRGGKRRGGKRRAREEEALYLAGTVLRVQDGYVGD